VANTGYNSILDRLPAIDTMGTDALTAARQQAVQKANLAANSSSSYSSVPNYSSSVSATGQRQAILSYAQKFLGTPYQWGGSNPQSGFDCSGLVQYVLGQNGVKIARTSQEQARAGKRTSISSLQPGDLVGWDEGGNTGVGHIAFYMGNGQILESPHTGADVQTRSLNSGGWDKNAFGISMSY
jgi:cell wall-associated NlpC family hydrolase